MQERNISTITLKRPFNVLGIKIKSPYACLIYSTQKDVTDEEMQQVSDWIISSGCRYAVCAGVKCSEWHDSIDWSYIASDPNYSPPDSRFIMTSWHTKETLEEIVWFWLMCTTYDDSMFENYLLLIIGEPQDLEERIIKAANEIDN